jgi:NADPH:quinone reductase-like Zn-dependent oxidoreductase
VAAAGDGGGPHFAGSDGGTGMKAVVCRRSGRPEVLEIVEVDRPAVPDDGVLVRVHAASLNPVDFFSLSSANSVARTLSRRRSGPEVVGNDFAGTVEAVGRGVTEFKAGDEVFGGKRGAFAEYLCVSERDGVVRKPASLTFEQAAAAPVAGLTALQAVRDHGRLQPGQRVLVNGASGGVGTFAVQLAREFGGEVTAVCSPQNVDLARSLGAAAVVDYTREDFTRGGRRYDLLLDIAGSKPWSACRRVLAPRATFVAIGGSVHTVWGGVGTLMHLAGVRLASIGSRRRAALFITRLNKPDLEVLRDLLESGRIRAVIDRRYALDDVVAAFHYMGEGHARGKIAIDVSGAAGKTSSRHTEETRP